MCDKCTIVTNIPSNPTTTTTEKQNKASALRREREKGREQKNSTFASDYSKRTTMSTPHRIYSHMTQLVHVCVCVSVPNNHKSNLLCIEIGLKADPSSHALIRLHKLLTHSFHFILFNFMEFSLHFKRRHSTIICDWKSK